MCFLLQLNKILKEFYYDMNIITLAIRVIKCYKIQKQSFSCYKEEFKIDDLDNLKSIHIKKYIEYL